MISWLHTLNDVEIEEPIGFDSVQFGVVRDTVYHGVGFEASTSTLEFYGEAYNIIDSANNSTGLKSNIIYVAKSKCEGEDTFTEVLRGRLNFGKLKKKCGNTCRVAVPVETDSCELVLKSRFDQQVDVDKTTGVDGTTALVRYAEMGNFIELRAKALKTGVIGSVEDAGDVFDASETQIEGGATAEFYIRPIYLVKVDESIIQGQLDPSSRWGDNISSGVVVSPVLLLDDFINCFDGGFVTSSRSKGSYDLTINGLSGNSRVSAQIWKGSDYVTGRTMLQDVQLYLGPDGHITGNFDVSYADTLSLIQGEAIYIVITVQVIGLNVLISGNVTFEKETNVSIEAVKTCADTTTQYYLVHEFLSHITEQITNGCLKVKSSYYGRTDSQPYDFPALGCGGLRMLTSGLKIRNADNPTFFTSLKNSIDGLQAIDNIGSGVEGTDLRIEEVAYFYRDKEICRCPAINSATIDVDESRHYAKVTAGYKNWKVEKINGLDEFNSEREYKLSFETISNELKIQSNLVTGSYPIEVTRQQSFAATGAADTSYDNEVFLICLRRSEYPYSSYEVEQGNIDNPENIFSPETVYNWRIRPVANMMRWYKTIAAGYRDFMNTLNKVFFSSGTGNILAKGKMSDDFCRPELNFTQENQDLLFSQMADFTPLWINEIITYDYPLSLSQYKAIKADPYGYVSFQCGNGDWSKGFIKELKYNPVQGMANFTLIRKYGV